MAVVCLWGPNQRVVVSNHEFVTELWDRDLKRQVGSQLVERTLFASDSTPDKPKSVRVSTAGDLALTISYFWDAPNLEHLWITVWDVVTGLPLTDRTHFEDDSLSPGLVDDASFDESGQHLLYVDNGRDGAKAVSALQLRPPQRLMSHLVEIVEALGGLEITRQGISVPVSDRIARLEQLVPLLVDR